MEQKKKPKHDIKRFPIVQKVSAAFCFLLQPFFDQPISRLAYQPISLLAHQSISPSAYQPSPSAYQLISLPAHQPISPSVHHTPHQIFPHFPVCLPLSLFFHSLPRLVFRFFFFFLFLFLFFYSCFLSFLFSFSFPGIESSVFPNEANLISFL